MTEAGLEEGPVGSSGGLGHPPTFLVTLQFNCHSSVLSLAVTVLYFPHFSPLYTLWLLSFVTSLKRNSIPPGCYATAGSHIGNTALKDSTASPI